MKHMKKIKYFWRGTNFNYPYTFVKLIPNKLVDKKENVIDTTENGKLEEKEKDKFFLKI